MTVPRRPAALPVLAVVLAASVMLVAGCAPAATPAASTTDGSGPLVIPNPEPSLTPVPGGPARSAVSSHAPRTTTTVEGFGEIADSLPGWFPKLPDQSDTEIGTATSGAYVSNLDPGAASRIIAAGLQAQGWTVDVSSPLEDGSLVLDATGKPEGCKTEVRFTPASGSILMSVLYGARCPAS